MVIIIFFIFSSPHRTKTLPPQVEALKQEANKYYCDKKDFTSAIRLYNLALKISPNSAVLFGNRAAAFMKRKWWVGSAKPRNLTKLSCIHVMNCMTKNWTYQTHSKKKNKTKQNKQTNKQKTKTKQTSKKQKQNKQAKKKKQTNKPHNVFFYFPPCIIALFNTTIWV